MIRLLEGGAWLVDGTQVIPDGPEAAAAVEAALTGGERSRLRRMRRRRPSVMVSWKAIIPLAVWRI